jgi:hypothetical protein
MKKTVFWLAASAFVMIALPWIAVTLVKGDAGMAACFALFFAVNPVFSILMGAAAGKKIRELWFFPFIPAILFLAGTWIFFARDEPAFLLYAGIYLAMGLVSMLISSIKK